MLFYLRVLLIPIILLCFPHFAWAQSGAVCGNSTVEGVENCDDGNLRDGDGCSSSCQLEVINRRYVRQGATGNGSGLNWTNAHTTLPTTLLRDTIYYIADGSYRANSYTFNTPQQTTALIIIKHATADDHGTSNGWQSSFGNGRAQFGAFVIDAPYFVLDELYITDNDRFYLVHIRDNRVYVKNSELDGQFQYTGPASNPESTGFGNSHGIGTQGGPDFVYILDNYLHDFAEDGMNYHQVTTGVIDGNLIENMHACGTNSRCVTTAANRTNGHSDGITIAPPASNITVSNNVILDSRQHTGIWVTQDAGGGTTQYVQDIQIFNNFIFTPEASRALKIYNADGIHIYNNVIWQAFGGALNIRENARDLHVYNNIISSIVFSDDVTSGPGTPNPAEHHFGYNIIGTTNGVGGFIPPLQSTDILASSPGFTNSIVDQIYNYGGGSYSQRNANAPQVARDNGLRDVTVFDFLPTANAPSIDSAISDINTPLTDYFGNGRVDDPNITNTGTGIENYYDRGAIEFGGSSGPPPPPPPNCQSNSECNDGDQCTQNICNNGNCENPINVGAACNDGVSCTTGESCNAQGVCGNGLTNDNLCPSLGCNLEFCSQTGCVYQGCPLPVPIMHLPFEEGIGTSTADVSGNGHDGTLINGPSWNNGHIGNGLDFDGINDYVSVNDFDYRNSGASGEFSVGFWFRNIDNSQRGTMFSHGVLGNPQNLQILFMENGVNGGGNLRTNFHDADDNLNEYAIMDVPGLADGIWHHYTLSVGSFGSRVYIDGNFVIGSNHGTGAFNPSTPIHIGAINGLINTRFYSDSIDEVFVVDRALVDSEVLDVYLNGFEVAPPPPNLIGITATGVPPNNTMELGSSFNFNVVGQYDDGSNQDVTAGSIVVEDTPNILLLQSGTDSILVTALDEGSTTLTVTFETKTILLDIDVECSDCDGFGFDCGNGICETELGEDFTNCLQDCHCGNGIADFDEDCDEEDLNNQTCQIRNLGLGNGILGCTNSCTFDTSHCIFSQPGPDMVIDNFERPLLGTDWTQHSNSGLVTIFNNSVIGLPANHNMGVISWIQTSFSADQFSEVVLSSPDIFTQVYVQRQNDNRRYGFMWAHAQYQPCMDMLELSWNGGWILKLDGYDMAQTLHCVSQPNKPVAGDVLRIDVIEGVLSGFHNDIQVISILENTLPLSGQPGIALSNLPQSADAMAVEEWKGGSLFSSPPPPPANLTGITVNGLPETLELELGDDYSATVTAHFDNDTAIDVTAQSSWVVDDPDILNVQSGINPVLVTTFDIGPTLVTVSYQTAVLLLDINVECNINCDEGFVCPNDICEEELGEDSTVCPEDCFCGNGELENGEECDDGCLNGI